MFLGLELVASRRLAMYYEYGILILKLCPIYGVCPLLGVVVFGGFTVHMSVTPMPLNGFHDNNQQELTSGNFSSKSYIKLVSVPRPHVKMEEGPGHQAYPDVSPRNVNCACPYM